MAVMVFIFSWMKQFLISNLIIAFAVCAAVFRLQFPSFCVLVCLAIEFMVQNTNSFCEGPFISNADESFTLPLVCEGFWLHMLSVLETQKVEVTKKEVRDVL